MRRTGHFSLTSVMSLLRKLWLEQSCAYTRKNPRNGRRTMNSKSRSICLDREKTLSKWFFLRAPRSVIHVQCTCDRPLTSVTETSKTTQLWFGGEGGRHWKCIHAWSLNSISFCEDFSLVNLIMCEGETFIDYRECYFLMTIPYIIVLSISAPYPKFHTEFYARHIEIYYSVSTQGDSCHILTIWQKFFQNL